MKRLFLYSIFILLPILIVYLYYGYNEKDSIWSVQCSIYKITGLQCPGCGGQRSFHYLLHGNILQALRYNALFILTLPFLLFMYFALFQAYGLKNMKYINSRLFGKKFGYITLFLLLIFFILRNISTFPFLYLSP